jgi:hypothetical protein
VVGGQRCSQGCHRVLDTELMHGKQVKIAFNDVNRLCFPAFLTGPVKPIKGSALAVNRCFRAVQVFGQRIVHYTAAKSHRLILSVENGKDDPVAKPVVVSLTFFAGNNQPGLQGHRHRFFFALKCLTR